MHVHYAEAGWELTSEGSTLLWQFKAKYAHDVPPTPYTRIYVHSTCYIYSLMLDDDYQALASHIEEGIVEKIKQGQYVDFAKLLPRDKSDFEEDNRMELVNRDGRSYYVLVSDRNKNQNQFYRNLGLGLQNIPRLICGETFINTIASFVFTCSAILNVIGE